VIDLLTISPMDYEIFTESVKKTGRTVVVHEAPRSFGVAAEIAARLMEKSFLYLEAPVKRVTGFDVHIPLFQKEKEYLPGVERILKAARQTLDF
jgi:pyruvate dehydrogenase E1 component beta subunit